MTELLGNDKIPSFPRTLRLEPTNICNLRCIFCQNRKVSVKRRYIDVAVASRILADAYQAGAREVGYFLFGEPLLHPNLDKLVAAASDIGYPHIYITTNGVLAKRPLIENLFANGLKSLQFSINAATRESYEAIHGYDHFDEVIKNLFEALSLRDELRAGGRQGLSIRTSFVYSPGQPEEMENLRGRLGSRLDEFKPREVFRENGLPNFGECTYPFTGLFVNAEAKLILCCHDFKGETEAADLNRESISSAWQGRQMNEVRHAFRNGQFFGLCAECMGNHRDQF